MDDSVVQAMARWPDVPAVYGWLRLDRRGSWYLIDRGHADFVEQRDGQGSLIRNEGIIDFIARNYQCDDNGAWFWQNGPQRAYADLDLAPLVLRVFNQGDRQSLVSHCGYPISEIRLIVQTAAGALLLATEQGVGAIHDLDLGALRLEFDDTDQPFRLDWNEHSYPISSAPADLLALQSSFQTRPRHPQYGDDQNGR